MTSMPASRSARAMTLAPRSCPSRPGLATSTRIFCSATPPFNHKGVHRDGVRSAGILPAVPRASCPPARRARRPRTPAETAALHCLDIQAPPQVPAGNAAVRLPYLRNLCHLLRLGHLAFLVMLLHCHLDAEIACGQD